MRVRIIKTDCGYVPQVEQFSKYFGNDGYFWYSIGGSHPDTWSDVEFIKKHCVFVTQWGANRMLKKWLKINIKGTKSLEAFNQQLENPNVIYEAEV